MSMSRAGQRLAVGKEIKRLRLAQSPRLSQAQLANLLEVSEPFVSLIERGHRGVSQANAHELSRIFHLNPADERAFLILAGYETDPIADPLARLIQAIMVDEPDHVALAEFVRADLLLAIHRWRRLARAQLDLRTGGAEEDTDQIARLADEVALSPFMRLHAQRQRAEEARMASALLEASSQLRGAEESPTLRNLANISSYHGALMRVELLAQKGDVALRRGDYREAYDLFEQCVRGYEELPPALPPESRAADATNPSQASATLSPEPEAAAAIISLGRGTLAQRLAEALMYLERTEEARAQCAEAERHLGQPDTPRKARLFRRITELRAWAHARQHDYARAIEEQTAACQLAAQAHDIEAEMLNWLFLGDHYLHLIAAETESIAQSTFAAQPKAIPLTPKAAWREALREHPLREHPRRATWLEQAEDAFQHAHEAQTVVARSRPGFSHAVAHCLRGMATVARLKDQTRKATDFLQRSEARERTSTSTPRLRFIFEERAELYWDCAFLSEARNEYRAALKAATSDLARMRKSQPKTREPHEAVGDVLRAHEQRLRRKLKRLEAAIIAQHGVLAAPERSGLDLQGARDIVERLRKLAIHAILDARWSPQTWDVGSETGLGVWLQEQEAMEREPGARLLAQGEFSLSLAYKLPSPMRLALDTPGGSARLGERLKDREQHFKARREAFLRDVEGAQLQDLQRHGVGHSVLDICSQLWVTSNATSPEVKIRASEAARLMRAFPQGYALAAIPIELPFAFAVKGRYTLIEAPDAFLAEAGVAPAVHSPIAHASDRGDYYIERRAGYRFDSPALAEEFTAHFMALYGSALKMMDRNATLDWLNGIAE